MGDTNSLIIKLENEMKDNRASHDTLSTKLRKSEEIISSLEDRLKEEKKLSSTREMEKNEMIRKKDLEIEEHLEAVSSLKRENTTLKKKISDLKDKLNNDI